MILVITNVVIDLRFVVTSHGAGCIEQGSKQVLLDVSHFRSVLIQTFKHILNVQAVDPE